MVLYGATVFLSAFLLLLVQPIISKLILPWFGGSAAVWTTCLVFSQAALLAGYVYADVSVRYLVPRRQVMVHTGLLIASLAALPIVPAAHWQPLGGENPSWLVLKLLAISIGVPYFLVAATTPMLQAWLARVKPTVNPYRLFALSNLASMLGLLGYPFLLEPWSRTRMQALGWSWAYTVFVGMCIAVALISLRRSATAQSVVDPCVRDLAPRVEGADQPALLRQLLWCTLAATSTILLLAVTIQVTRNLAAIPLLWIAPLTIYLFSFILVFDSARWYRRGLLLPVAGAAVVVMALPLQRIGKAHDVVYEIGVFLAGLFAVCLFAHGELARSKPAARYLTRFYLMISLGGAAGSALVGIAAPLLLPAYFELPAGLVLCALLIYLQSRTESSAHGWIAVAVILVAVLSATVSVRGSLANTVSASRNFYGSLRVIEMPGDGTDRVRTLVDGTTLHGIQVISKKFRRDPTSYYTPSSGVGRVLTALNRNRAPLRIGVIGLGAGTLAAYGRSGDTYRFYEINPAVIMLANREFTFLMDSSAAIQTVLGDARLQLEREPPQGFDLLVIDAFSSDAIPVHLLTREALALYRRHVRDDGVIAFDISNRFVNLAPVVGALAAAENLRAIYIVDAGNDGVRPQPNKWVLVAQTPGILDQTELASAAQPPGPRKGVPLWTDDFNSLLPILK